MPSALPPIITDINPSIRPAVSVILDGRLIPRLVIDCRPDATGALSGRHLLGTLALPLGGPPLDLDLDLLLEVGARVDGGGGFPLVTFVFPSSGGGAAVGGGGLRFIPHHSCPQIIVQ